MRLTDREWTLVERALAVASERYLQDAATLRQLETDSLLTVDQVVTVTQFEAALAERAKQASALMRKVHDR